MYRETIRILKVKWEFVTNNRSLLPSLPLKVEVPSLLTDFHRVEKITPVKSPDVRLVISDRAGGKPFLRVKPGLVTAGGDLIRLTETTRDQRYTLFGNEGLVFRYTLKLLEDKYGIHSFHACGMYHPRRKKLFLICGSAGSGKTCFILRGLELGLQLFSTEMAHFRIADGIVEFYKGSLVDNVRIANLKYNYPSLLKKLELRLPAAKNEWGKKIALDLSRFQTGPDVLTNPETVLILPHIEQERRGHFFQEEKDRRKISRNLFENASEKIADSVLLYEILPFAGADNPSAASGRVAAINGLLLHPRLKKVFTVISGPENCWRKIVE